MPQNIMIVEDHLMVAEATKALLRALVQILRPDRLRWGSVQIKGQR